MRFNKKNLDKILAAKIGPGFNAVLEINEKDFRREMRFKWNVVFDTEIIKKFCLVP